MNEPTTQTRELPVQNKMGIHARPAAMIVRIANKFPAVSLDVVKDDEQVNGKSIMGLMMLAAGPGPRRRLTPGGTAGGPRPGGVGAVPAFLGEFAVG